MPGTEKDQTPGEPQEAVAEEAKRATGGDAADAAGAGAGGGGQAVGTSASAPEPEQLEPPDRTEEASEGGNEAAEERVDTVYEPTGRGHRVIRRTTKRRTTTEDIQETIEEEYPLPAAYPVPGSTHPAPVG